MDCAPTALPTTDVQPEIVARVGDPGLPERLARAATAARAAAVLVIYVKVGFREGQPRDRSAQPAVRAGRPDGRIRRGSLERAAPGAGAAAGRRGAHQAQSQCVRRQRSLRGSPGRWNRCAHPGQPTPTTAFVASPSIRRQYLPQLLHERERRGRRARSTAASLCVPKRANAGECWNYSLRCHSEASFPRSRGCARRPVPCGATPRSRPARLRTAHRAVRERWWAAIATLCPSKIVRTPAPANDPEARSIRWRRCTEQGPPRIPSRGGTGARVRGGGDARALRSVFSSSASLPSRGPRVAEIRQLR